MAMQLKRQVEDVEEPPKGEPLHFDLNPVAEAVKQAKRGPKVVPIFTVPEKCRDDFESQVDYDLYLELRTLKYMDKVAVAALDEARTQVASAASPTSKDDRVAYDNWLRTRCTMGVSRAKTDVLPPREFGLKVPKYSLAYRPGPGSCPTPADESYQRNVLKAKREHFGLQKGDDRMFYLPQGIRELDDTYTYSLDPQPYEYLAKTPKVRASVRRALREDVSSHAIGRYLEIPDWSPKAITKLKRNALRCSEYSQAKRKKTNRPVGFFLAKEERVTLTPSVMDLLRYPKYLTGDDEVYVWHQGDVPRQPQLKDLKHECVDYMPRLTMDYGKVDSTGVALNMIHLQSTRKDKLLGYDYLQDKYEHPRHTSVEMVKQDVVPAPAENQLPAIEHKTVPIETRESRALGPVMINQFQLGDCVYSVDVNDPLDLHLMDDAAEHARSYLEFILATRYHHGKRHGVVASLDRDYIYAEMQRQKLDPPVEADVEEVIYLPDGNSTDPMVLMVPGDLKKRKPAQYRSGPRVKTWAKGERHDLTYREDKEILREPDTNPYTVRKAFYRLARVESIAKNFNAYAVKRALIRKSERYAMDRIQLEDDRRAENKAWHVSQVPARQYSIFMDVQFARRCSHRAMWRSERPPEDKISSLEMYFAFREHKQGKFAPQPTLTGLLSSYVKSKLTWLKPTVAERTVNVPTIGDDVEPRMIGPVEKPDWWHTLVLPEVTEDVQASPVQDKHPIIITPRDVKLTDVVKDTSIADEIMQARVLHKARMLDQFLADPYVRRLQARWERHYYHRQSMIG